MEECSQVLLLASQEEISRGEGYQTSHECRWVSPCSLAPYIYSHWRYRSMSRGEALQLLKRWFVESKGTVNVRHYWYCYTVWAFWIVDTLGAWPKSTIQNGHTLYAVHIPNSWHFGTRSMAFVHYRSSHCIHMCSTTIGVPLGSEWGSLWLAGVPD